MWMKDNAGGGRSRKHQSVLEPLLGAKCTPDALDYVSLAIVYRPPSWVRPAGFAPRARAISTLGTDRNLWLLGIPIGIAVEPAELCPARRWAEVVT